MCLAIWLYELIGERVGILAPIRLVQANTVPGDGSAAGAPPEAAVAEDGRSIVNTNESCYETPKVPVLLNLIPVQPAEFVVLAVGIVVTPLRTPDFVAHEHHGPALGKKQDCEVVLELTVAQ